MAGDTASVVFVPSAYILERIIVYPEVVSHLEKRMTLRYSDVFFISRIILLSFLSYENFQMLRKALLFREACYGKKILGR